MSIKSDIMDVLNFLNKPCRFKLKDGKEIFGIIWKGGNDSCNYFFSTLAEYKLYKTALANNDKNSCELIINNLNRVNIQEIIKADFLPEQYPIITDRLPD